MIRNRDELLIRYICTSRRKLKHGKFKDFDFDVLSVVLRYSKSSYSNILPYLKIAQSHSLSSCIEANCITLCVGVQEFVCYARLQFYSANARTKFYSSNLTAISVITSDWHFKSNICRSVRKCVYLLK